MTCVVGWLEEGTRRVHMAVDSAGSAWNSIRTRKDPKLFRLTARGKNRRDRGEDFLIGACGSFRFMQILQFHVELPARDPDEDPYVYMVKHFIPTLRQAVTEAGYLSNKHGQESIYDGSCLVGFAGRLFMISSDFQVEERDTPYNATGSGEFYALGALHALHEYPSLPPEGRLHKALQAAEAFCPSVRGPFSFDVL